MIALHKQHLLVATLLTLGSISPANATYWNVFNIEGESAVPAAFVTYDTLSDMLSDTNRVSLTEPTNFFGRNIVESGSDGTTFWNLFNIEGESTVPAAFVTYNSLADMLTDTNRVSLVEPVGFFARNIVGTGSDGSMYWNVFNIEGESSISSAFVTYNSLTDMLNDTNRVSLVEPTNFFGRNIVGSDSDGTSYWNVFNIEGESTVPAAFVTYNSLTDMLFDTNRVSLVEPTNFFGRNIVGSGATKVRTTIPVPEPGTLLLLCLGLVAISLRNGIADRACVQGFAWAR